MTLTAFIRGRLAKDEPQASKAVSDHTEVANLNAHRVQAVPHNCEGVVTIVGTEQRLIRVAGNRLKTEDVYYEAGRTRRLRVPDTDIAETTMG
jgi:hypothetical protein